MSSTAARLDIGFPFQFDGRGKVADVPYPDHVEQMLEIAILTVPGERVNRPGFGAGLMRMVFEGANDDTGAALQLELRAALQDTFRGVLELEDLTVQLDDTRFDVTVVYRLLRDTPRVARFTYDTAAWGRGPIDTVGPRAAQHARNAPARPPAVKPATPAPEPAPLPWIDYLAKDYDSFRAAMLDRMAMLVPAWSERNAADPGVTVLEALAYAADFLSYAQDAVGTEAHPQTARQRRSMARHGRLRDWRFSEGCNARTWVTIALVGARQFVLPAGSELLTRVGDIPVAFPARSLEHARCLDHAPSRFRTMHAVTLTPHLSAIRFAVPPGRALDLAPGATQARLAGHLPELHRGDLLLLEQVRDPDSGETWDADPLLRQVVRLSRAPVLTHDPDGTPVTHIVWHVDDALGFRLPLAAARGGVLRDDLALARGNVVLADHGALTRHELPPVPRDRPYQPALDVEDLTWAVPLDHLAAREHAASEAVTQDPRQAVADMVLLEGDPRRPVRVWRSRPDLLGSGRFAADFVAEPGPNGWSLRFGDGNQGRLPAPGTRMTAVCRRGVGPSGNIGADALAHLVTNHLALREVVRAVRNPIGAKGGVRAETVERARILMPAAARAMVRSVLPEDVVALLRRHQAVGDAYARIEWRGDWRTILAWVLPADDPTLAPAAGDPTLASPADDPTPGPPADDQTLDPPLVRARIPARNLTLDPALARDLERRVAPTLTIGHRIAVHGPALVPLDIALRIEAAPGALEARLRQDLGTALAAALRRSQQRLGAPLELADLFDAAAAVPGVLAVSADRFMRLNEPLIDARATGVLAPGPTAVVTAGIDPADLRFGRIALHIVIPRPAR